MTEYSESRPFPVRPVVDKLVTERVAALPAEDLQSHGLYSGRDVHQALVGLHLLGQGVGTDRVGESRPGSVVFVLLCAEEKAICLSAKSTTKNFTSRKEDDHICCTRTFPH